MASHNPQSTPHNDNGQRYRDARKVTLIGSVVDLVLGIIKILAGVAANSQGLIADGIHSLSDLATDAMVLFAMKHGSKAADENHPYGHARIETLATILLGFALIVVAAGIAWDAAVRLSHPETLLQPGLLALAIAMISILAKEAIYHYTIFIADKYQSSLLRANAWHSRSDAISSIIVAIGVAGTLAGIPSLDAIAAIGVAIMIARIGVDFAWESAQELIDTAMQPDQVEAIRQAILDVDGVIALHKLRTRHMGSDGLVDVHILVNPRISVSEGHRISDRVRSEIMRTEASITDVMVHIDPEDDETIRPSAGLPLRKAIQQQLKECWRDFDAINYINEITVHYLDGKIHVEVLLPLENMESIADAQKLAHQLANLAQTQTSIARLEVHFR